MVTCLHRIYIFQQTKLFGFTSQLLIPSSYEGKTKNKHYTYRVYE